MRSIFNKLLFIGLAGVVLGACSASADTKESSVQTTEETDEVAEETSIVAEDITTTFYPKVTRLRNLSEEDLEWYDIIMTRLNAIDDATGDRETVYEIAEEYGEDPEELYADWLEIVDAKWFGEYGNYAILQGDLTALTTEIIEKNIVGEKIEYMDGEFQFDEDHLTTSGSQKVHVDGETHKISYVIEHRNDYEIAEVVKLIIDGEKII